MAAPIMAAMGSSHENQRSVFADNSRDGFMSGFVFFCPLFLFLFACFIIVCLLCLWNDVVEIPFKGVVADATTSESFFLKDEVFVENMSTVFSRSSEIEIAVVSVVFIDDAIVDDIDGTMLFAVWRCRTVLCMYHLWRDIDNDAAYRFSVLHGIVQYDVLWKACVEEFYF